MANQPTKYRKFVVGAASAALVASAVAPVASAAEFKDTKGNTHEAAIDALSDAGVINGYPDGTFQPNKTLTRSDVVKLMGKWLVSEGYAVPTDYKTSPRFTDLTSASNDELLKYAAVVKDNGVFVGTPDGKLDAAGNITRENMAIVLVRAFDEVHGIDLATYVAAQDFKKDVTDRGTAKAEARPAIDVLDFFDITNPAAPQFNPKATTTRGQFATFLHKTLNADFSAVGSVVSGTIKAINATTVEVTFKEAVGEVKATDFAIEGLTVTNAVVKQTDAKTVVLTTAVQEGGKKYAVSFNGGAVGSFEGISAVIPTKIEVNTDSVQGIVGQQVTLKADIGVKAEGVPVTFNVKAAINSLNTDQVKEVYTDANGIATFTYTQYNAGFGDEVAAYPTGTPATRDFATVHWGVDTILKLEVDDKKSNELNNGENKVYKVTYKDPKTGKPVQGKDINVTFVENIDVAVNKITHATANGKTPYQLTDGKKVPVTVKTDSKGEATITVSGTNTKATPVVFIDGDGSVAKANDKLDRTELQVRAEELSFGAVHVKYELEVTRDGGEEAATGPANGREYKVVVKDENGKAAAGEVVNVAFDEVLDRVISTSTDAKFVEDLDAGVKIVAGSRDQQITLTLNSKGEGKFTIVSEDNKDYATPVMWIDINTANNKEGTLEEGEPKKTAAITYFADEKVTGSKVRVYEKGTNNEIKDNRTIDAGQAVEFRVDVANQSGEVFKAKDKVDIRDFEATYQVTNTGRNDVLVWSEGKEPKVISTRRSETFTVKNANGDQVKLYVQSVDGKSASVEVTAYGEVVEYNKADTKDYKVVRLSESKVAKATFKASNELGTSQTGQVVNFNKDKKKITLSANGITYKELDYKEQFDAGKVKYEKVENGATVKWNFEQFENEVSNFNAKNITVHYYKDADGNITFTITKISDESNPTNPGETALADAIKAAENANLVEAEYTAESWKTYADALAEAKAVASSAPDADKAAAAKTLKEAQAALAKKSEVPGEEKFAFTSQTATPSATLPTVLSDYNIAGTIANSVGDVATVKIVLEDAAGEKTDELNVVYNAENRTFEFITSNATAAKATLKAYDATGKVAASTVIEF